MTARLESALRITGHVAFAMMCVALSLAAFQYIRSAAPPIDTPAEAPIERGLTLPAAAAMRDAMGTKGLLVLALSPSCRFCTRSMPFYRRLAALREVLSSTVPMLIVSPQPLKRTSAYLNQYALQVPLYARSVDEVGLVVTSTPVLVLVNVAEVVINSWEGMLPPTSEDQVIAEVRTLAGS